MPTIHPGANLDPCIALEEPMAGILPALIRSKAGARQRQPCAGPRVRRGLGYHNGFRWLSMIVQDASERLFSRNALRLCSALDAPLNRLSL